MCFLLSQLFFCTDGRFAVSHADAAGDRVVFLKAAFSAYSRIVDVIELGQRADLCAVAVHLFSGMSSLATLPWPQHSGVYQKVE